MPDVYSWSFRMAKEILLERETNGEPLLELGRGIVSLADSGLQLQALSSAYLKDRFVDKYFVLVDTLLPVIVPDNRSSTTLCCQADYVIYIAGQPWCGMNIDADRLIASWLRLPRIFALTRADIPITWFWIQPVLNVWAGEPNVMLELRNCNFAPATIVEFAVPADDLEAIDEPLHASMDIAVIYKTIQCFAGVTSMLPCISRPLFLFVTGENLALEPELCFEIILDFYKKGEKIHLSDANTTPIHCKTSKNTVLIPLDDDYISCETDARDMVNALASNNLDSDAFPWDNIVGCPVEMNLKLSKDVNVSCIDFNNVMQMGKLIGLRHA